MQTLFAVLVATLIFATHGSPAGVPPDMNPTYAALQDARRAMEAQESDSQTGNAARRRAAAFEVHQFEAHLAEFADAWNDFVKEYSDKGTYNLKKAKLLSKALKKLQPHLPR